MNPTLFTNPYLMVAFAGLSIYGTMSAGKAEQNRQNSIAAQQKQNARFEELNALQAHNERQSRLSALINANDTLKAVNRRGGGDRSAARLEAAEKRKSKTSDSRARTQSMLTLSRTRFAAADAKASGNQAVRSALFESRGTGLQAYDMYKVL